MNFAALDIALGVPRRDVAKFEKLARDIDAAFLKGDATELAAIIEKAFA